jgi:hypothetical protein
MIALPGIICFFIRNVLLANRIKLHGTTAPIFQVGLKGATLSSEQVTVPYSLVLPPTIGSQGDTLVLDENGHLQFDSITGRVVNVPYIAWTATSDGQTEFTSTVLGQYPAGTELTIFRNGILMAPAEYSYSGTVLTVYTMVSVGDDIEIPSRGITDNGGQPSDVPYINWTATADGQTEFISTTLAQYPVGTSLAVFRNGILMAPDEYTISGNTLTMVTYVYDGDDIEIPSKTILASSTIVTDLGSAPATSTSPGVVGEVRIADGYIYVCISTNQWQRSAMSTW